ncbi:50S ribosomal protein 5, chloroplastic [Jatropha curcas]|uniref:50S ribosomal protein 5, chloroplastic n=1 Tax=Jatropha curcas TaxID=180498 RepID=UPI0005FB4145|nr:50S ribosomal protein 5, chloroplastic [Jatropha curcas]XP_012092543.1 50S ribosomal protein 5, chloroplastic [Jatropha curcas]
MGVFLMSFPSLFPSPDSASMPFSANKANAISSVSGLHSKSTDLLSKSLTALSFNSPMAVKALAEIKGTGPDGGDSVSESDEEDVPLFGDLSLDSKLQQKLEHKMKVKLAKNIKLRNKKLVRKRRMRKKGKWPPSKARNL